MKNSYYAVNYKIFNVVGIEKSDIYDYVFAKNIEQVIKKIRKRYKKFSFNVKIISIDKYKEVDDAVYLERVYPTLISAIMSELSNAFSKVDLNYNDVDHEIETSNK
ncbi:MAG TPA: hypothetical protein PLP51_01085 [Acholeplasmataceae bacterium]|nr:hypothetical protein [Acholeplasmataceae bacterium]